MIYEAASLVSEYFEAISCPIRLVYGPERMTDHAYVDSRVVIERLRGRGGDIMPPRATAKNPRRRFRVGVPGLVTIYAKSGIAGARTHDHEREMDRTVDAVLCGLAHAAAKMRTILHPLSGEIVDDDDVEQWPGTIFEIEFWLERSVEDRTWEGDAAPEGKIPKFVINGCNCADCGDDDDDEDDDEEEEEE